VHAIPESVVRAQIRAVSDDLRPSAAKTGMLATADLVREVAACVDRFGIPRLVVDPVMVATSGDRLLDRDAERTVAELLLPLATLVTPNLDEAAILADMPIRDEDGMREAASVLIGRGARAVLLKGGHLPGPEVVDLLFDGVEVRTWRRPKIDTRSTHGTGCTLSAAIAAGLAHGRPLADAVEAALDYVRRAIAAAPGLGRGNGPLNHMVSARR
jgi:hydroxymethylpyrimidine/phosphomethylpyrimidine kinase